MDSPRSTKKAGVGDGHGGTLRTATKEMCFYCFDVLHNELHHMGAPDPKFTNESL